MANQRISAMPSGAPAQANDAVLINRSGTNYRVTAASIGGAFKNLPSWQAVQTSNFTAVSGSGYFVNTTSAAITMTLPAIPTAGDVIAVVDYAGTFATNNLTINTNGNKLNGALSLFKVTTNRAGLQIVYVDSTQGWECFGDTSGSLLVEQFTINGLVVAGGGSNYGAALNTRGGAGAGGFRTYQAVYPSSPSPGTIETGTVTVGAGGGIRSPGINGSDSVLNTITSAGGGYGGTGATTSPGNPGGSGGGAALFSGSGGSGNVPAVSPSQGNPGAAGSFTPATGAGAGGGGAGSPGESLNGIGGSGAISTLLGTFSSTTSNTLGTGSKTFTVPTGLSNLNAGEGIRAAIDASNYMDCQITSYNSGTGALVINANNAFFVVGSGTSTSWTFIRLYACGGGAGNNSSRYSFSAANTGSGVNSGVVLISVPNTASVTFSGGVTSTMTTVGTNKVYKVTATSTTSETYTVTVP